MIDGKVAQALTNKPSGSTCTICGATPRQMNGLTKVASRPENENYILFGTLPIRTSPALENCITKMCKNLMKILCRF